MKLNLKEIEARHEAATEEPWGEHKEAGADIIGNKDTIILEICRGVKTQAILRDNNLQFIIHARTDIPALCDEVERGQSIETALRNLYNDCRNEPCDEQRGIVIDNARKALEQE